MRDKRKKVIGVTLLVLALSLAFQAVTHSQFYKDLEWLNVDKHQH